MISKISELKLLEWIKSIMGLQWFKVKNNRFCNILSCYLVV